MSSRRNRNFRRRVVLIIAFVIGMLVYAPGAWAGQAFLSLNAPAPKMYGYAAGPAQRDGTAAGRSHYVSASATRTNLRVPGHQAPKPDLASPAMAAPKLVHTGDTKTAPGHVVTHQRTDAAPLHATTAAATVTDNASYSVAATYDTVPMANQTGRVAVTLTNTGTSTWSHGYGLGTEVYPASDTTGTGTPLTTGTDVVFGTSVAPGQSVTVESVTPNENPGTYTLCWDMETSSGVFLSAEGGSTYCAAYTIQQFPAQVNEQEPLPGTIVDSQTPQLSASGTVPGGYPAKPEFWFAFQVVTPGSSGNWLVVQSSGWVAGNGDSWTVPKPLNWGATYYWQAAVSDASSPPSVTSTSVTWTTPTSFVVGSAQPSVQNRLGNVVKADDGNPVMTSDLGASGYNGSGKTVDPKTANVTQQATDASVATAGPALSVVRTYNSLDPRTSQAFGAGWSSPQDMSLAPDLDATGALILTLSSGEQVRFAKNAGGGYAPPQNMYAVVTALSGGGFSVTDQTGTTYRFDQPSGSSWLVSKITDDQGRAETFGYTGGELTAITNNVSGRALHLTWATPSGATYPHVATVSTDAVIVGQPTTALNWTYGYSGDLLTSVCPPGTTTACTEYNYITNGSHAPTGVLDANPSAYYRLDDQAGTTAAANEVPVDDLTTVNPPATEMNTTLGVPGPVAGVTATGFNGSSSYVPMDGAWCTTASQTSSCIPVTGSNRIVTSSTTGLGFSVWFKTSKASGVLLGLTSSLPGSCTTGCAASIDSPILWITSTGQLEGAGALTSSAVVDDGTWHQAVIVPGQALYVDGKKAPSTGSNTFTTPAGAYALLGAGLVPTGTTASWEFFNGSLADFAVYQNQLPGAGTVAAQYAAETRPAAELTSVTSPGGRTEMSATYDTVNDRVASLTDAQGGTWNFSGPVTQSLSAGYDGAVLASAPEDFWPLSDTSGPLAHDLVGGAATAASPRPPATYANATLGVAGPTGFADGTAASFSGSGSQLSIPGGYFAGTGGAGESVELWFSATKAGTLLSTGSGSGGNPPILWVNSGGCVEGTVNGVVLNGSTPCASAIGDGKWHQVIFTLSPVGTNSTGTSSTQNATLYVDGKVLASSPVTPATVSGAGYTAVVGNGSHGDFAGSLADVSLYATQLSATDVTQHYTGLHNQVLVEEPGNPALPTYLATPTLNTQTITVTDPFGKKAFDEYADGNLIKATDALGGTTYYGYDVSDRVATVTDPDGNTTYTTHDSYNNVTSTTTCAAVNDCQTIYTSYFENLSNPLDTRNNKPTDDRDARSSSPSDPTYDTVTAYTNSAQILSKTTPPTTQCPSGCKTAYTYTTGSEAAVGGGTEPAGLLASTTAPGGGVTSYAYDSAGDVATVTNPLKMVTEYAYDNVGRELSETQISDTYPAGLTTTYAYDDLDRVVSETDPPITDRVTGSAVHTKVTTRTYDPDDNVLTSTISDATGGDPSRTTTSTYDVHGNVASVTDPLGNKATYTYDALGDKTSVTNPAGVATDYTYDAAGNLLTTTLEGYTGNPSAPIPAQNLVQDSRAYDPAGHLASETAVNGTTTDYTYYGNGETASSYITGSSGNEDVHTYSYDAAGNKVSESDPGGLVTDATYNADNQVASATTDPTGVDRTSTAVYDADGNLVTQTLSGGGVTQTRTMTYNAMDQELSQTIDNTGGNLTTTYVRDRRGLVVSETDPAGNETTYENDEAGRTVVTTSPEVLSQNGSGAAPVTAAAVAMTGYDTFGDKTETSDADGNVTTYGYDQDGQQVSQTDPSYTAPGSPTPVSATTTVAFNSLGLKTSDTDPLGNVTTYGYDQLGDMTSQTDPNGGVTTYTYDKGGQQTSVTNPTGAQTQATYNNVGQLATTTDLVRQNTSAAYSTTYGYDAAGNRTSQTSPTGVVTRAAYNAVGEEISSTDGAGNTTGYAYNLDGKLTKTTLSNGTATTVSYDLAGREVGQADLDANGSTLRSESATYTLDGQVATSKDYRGDTTTSTYDATGMLISQTQPVSAGQSITVGYGYDLDGNRTALTDGNGNTTYTTYNSLGLPQTITEPTTASHNTTADSTTTDVYDADGNLVTQNLPGGVQVNDSYDADGNLTGQSGSGATAATADRTFTYDGDGKVLTAATSAAGTAGSFGYQPATSETFQYDDRGLLLSASGSAGTTVLAYNSAGQLASAADAAGTSTYTYDSAGRLATDADAASGQTGTYSYNNLDQVTQISYGSGNNTQAFGYDSLNRLASDTLDTASGTQVASIGYGYNANNDVTSMTTSGLSTASGSGSVTNTYGYDEADRLTSWTATPSAGTAATQTYGYDNDGNLTNDNGATYTYDARDELVSDGKNSYSYSADGDLTSVGASAYSFDAYGQQITAGVSAYAWDALNRVVTAATFGSGGSTEALTYEAMSNEVASDSSATYSRDPSGSIVGVDSTAGGKTLALNNQHNDLSGLFTASGTALAASTTYSPWGQTLSTSGPTVQVGYQGQWTDAANGQVNMGSRFYQTGTGSFTAKDTYTGAQGGAAVSDNAYAYGDDNPVTVTDPTGHAPSGSYDSGNISWSEVEAAYARAAAAKSASYLAAGEADRYRWEADTASAAAGAAARLANMANASSRWFADKAAKAAQAAAQAFAAANFQWQQAASWQERADAAWAQAAADAKQVLNVSSVGGFLSSVWHDVTNPVGAVYNTAGAAYETHIALDDEWHALLASGKALGDIFKGLGLLAAAGVAAGAARRAADIARGLDRRSQELDAVASADERSAAAAAARSRAESALASSYWAEANSLRSAYARQQLRKLETAAKKVFKFVKKALKVVRHYSFVALKVAYKVSGVQSVVSCATDPTLSSCLQAAATVAIVLATGGTGEVAVAADEGLASAAEFAAKSLFTESSWICRMCAGIGALTGAAGSANSGIENHQSGLQVLQDALYGGASGALGALPGAKLGPFGLVLAGGAAGVGGGAAQQLVNDNYHGIDWRAAGVDGGLGAFGGGLGGYLSGTKLGDKDGNFVAGMVSAGLNMACGYAGSVGKNWC